MMKFICSLTLVLLVSAGAYAQEVEKVEKIVVKVDGEVIVEQEVVVREDEDVVVREINIDSSGIENFVEHLMEAIEHFVENGAESIGRLIESAVGEHHGFDMARSEAGVTRDVNQTQAVKPGGDIEIKNVAGSIVIEGWNKNEISVVGTLGEHVERLKFEVDGRDVEIEVVVPRRHRRKIRSELTIRVPRTSRIEIEGVSASVDCSNLETEHLIAQTVSGNVTIAQCTGDIEAESVSGSVKVHDAQDDVDAETVSGSVEVRGSPGDVRAESVSGSVRVYGATESVRAESVSGSISIEGEKLEELDAETVSGSIGFSGSLAKDAEVDLNTLSGSIKINFDGPVYGDYDLQTFTGTIRCPFGPAPSKSSRGRGKQLRFNHGDGDADISMETFSGSITIQN